MTPDTRKNLTLNAAAKRLGSATFDWSKGLTYDMLVEDTGIDRKTIAGDFGSKANLIAELVRYCLEPDNFSAFGEEFAEDLVETIASSLLNRNVDLFESTRSSGDLDFKYIRSDQRLRAQLSIWALAQDDENAKNALATMYRFYDDEHLRGWRMVTADLAQSGVAMRSGLTSEEVITALTALVEGLAIRWHVDPDAVPDDLFGRIFGTVIAALFDPFGDAEVSSIQQLLSEIDAKRRGV